MANQKFGELNNGDIFRLGDECVKISKEEARSLVTGKIKSVDSQVSVIAVGFLERLWKKIRRK